MPWILITLLLLFLLINPSVTLAVGFPPFPNTTNNIHIGQVFNYRITNPDDELGKVDIVWGSGYANQPSGMYNTRYIPFDRVPTYNPDDSLSTHDLAWFQTNHPDWIEYQCDGVTPAYEYGSQNVPLDITNPD